MLCAVEIAVALMVVPPSTLMIGRWLTLRTVDRTVMPLSAISPALSAAVIASEDARFCLHHGVDWSALREVVQEADDDGPDRGASTLTMQTAKNVFLWPSRSYIRKAIEIPLASVLDAIWGKRRVIEVYLNIAEWGDGIFGAEAASRYYFGKPARDLTTMEAALLATSLPNPSLRDPARPSRTQRALAARLSARIRGTPLDCLNKR